MPPGLRVPAFLAAAVAIAYLNGFAGVFQFDDHKVIVDNATVHSFAAWLADLGRGIRPLLKLTYTLNWILGPGEAGFHAFNLAVHLANTLLVFSLTKRLAQAHGLQNEGEARTAAVVAALLFGLHPAQTEAVTYISGRSASLMTMFYLGGLAAYAAGTESRRRWLLHGVSPALFGLAVATKEVAITFPLAILWWEACRREGRPDWRAILRRQAVHWALLLAVAAVLLAHPVYGSRLVPDFDGESLRRNALSQLDAITYLVLRLVRLYPLNIDPDLRMASDWNLTLMVEAVFLAAIGVAGALSLRRRRWWGLGLAWFLLQIAPTNSILPRADLANDRHLYLAGIGLFVAAGIEIARISAGTTRRRPWVWFPAAATILFLAAATAWRNRDYSSEVRLWEQTSRVSPEKPRVFNNLGHAYSQAEKLERAEEAYREALRLHPGYDVARDNLGILMLKRASPANRQATGALR